jgi:hypothetical protein
MPSLRGGSVVERGLVLHKTSRRHPFLAFGGGLSAQSGTQAMWRKQTGFLCIFDTYLSIYFNTYLNTYGTTKN